MARACVIPLWRSARFIYPCFGLCSEQTCKDLYRELIGDAVGCVGSREPDRSGASPRAHSRRVQPQQSQATRNASESQVYILLNRPASCLLWVESTVAAAEQSAKPAATNVKAAEAAKRPKPNNRISKMALVDSDSDSDHKSSSPSTAAADTDAGAPEASVAPEPPAPSDAVAATTEVAEETTEASASKIAKPDIDPYVKVDWVGRL